MTNSTTIQRPELTVSGSGLGIYLVAAFAITFLTTAPMVASHQGWISNRIGTSWHAVGALGPLAGALIVSRRSRPAADHLSSGLRRWRVSGWYYLAALSPLIFLAPAAVITRLTDGDWPPISLLADSGRFEGGGWVPALLIPALAYGIGEEMGWRGVALPRLQARFRPLVASLVLGGIWVAWHVPFYLYREGMAGAPFGEQIAQAVVIVIGGMFLAWLYNSTGGSILLCALWHFSHSVVHIAAPEISQTFDTYNGVLSTVLAILVTVIWWRQMSTNTAIVYPPDGSGA